MLTAAEGMDVSLGGSVGRCVRSASASMVPYRPSKCAFSCSSGTGLASNTTSSIVSSLPPSMLGR